MLFEVRLRSRQCSDRVVRGHCVVMATPTVGIGYWTLYETVMGFTSQGQLPHEIKPFADFLDEDDSMAATLARCRACSHIKMQTQICSCNKARSVIILGT